MVIQPRSVPPSHALRWFSDGLRLSARRPLWFVLLLVLMLPLGMWASALIQFALAPTLLGCGVVLALSSEHDSSFPADLGDRCAASCRRMALATLAGAPIVLLVAMMISLLVQSQEVARGDAAPAAAAAIFSFEPANILLITLFLWFVALGPILWFFIPLLVLEKLPLKLTLALAVRAYSRNLYIAIITSLIAMIFAFGTLLSILLFPLFAVVVCAMYLSYRDIFYGEALKMATRARTAVPATSS